MIEIGRVPLGHDTQSPVAGVEGFLDVRNVVANDRCGGTVLCHQAAKIRSFSRGKLARRPQSCRVVREGSLDREFNPPQDSMFRNPPRRCIHRCAARGRDFSSLNSLGFEPSCGALRKSWFDIVNAFRCLASGWIEIALQSHWIRIVLRRAKRSPVFPVRGPLGSAY